jgi:hypothetical protein
MLLIKIHNISCKVFTLIFRNWHKKLRAQRELMFQFILQKIKMPLQNIKKTEIHNLQNAKEVCLHLFLF